MITKLPPSIYSPDQLSSVTWELSRLISVLRKEAIRSTVTKSSTKNEAITEITVLLQDLLKASNVAQDDQLKLEQLHKEIKTLRDDAPSIRIILAAFPASSIKAQLVKWLRKEVSPQLLCVFSVRGDIGGGVIIRTNSKQFDFSFKSKLIGNRYRIGELFADVR